MENKKVNKIKIILLILLILGLIYWIYKQDIHISTKINKQTVKTELNENHNDRKEIKQLMEQVLNWSDSKESINLLPVLEDSTNSFYIGFDMNELKVNLEKLKETGFFADEFIDNYNQIILTLDKKLRNGEYEKWLVGDLPTFNFVNDINPWCLCQDKPNDSADLFDIEIKKLSDNMDELNWKWTSSDPSWAGYGFRVIKEDNKWKISYMEGFDFKESTE